MDLYDPAGEGQAYSYELVAVSEGAWVLVSGRLDENGRLADGDRVPPPR